MEPSHIPNLAGLNELANRDGVDIKPTLLRVMTDLYVQKPQHSVEEERHYTELALRLVDQVDAATRAIVTGRLERYPAAPHAIMQRLSRPERSELAPPSLPAAAAMPPVIAAPTPAVAAASPAVVADAAPPVTATPVSPATGPATPPVGGSSPAELSELFLGASAEERRMILLNLDTAPLPSAAPIPRHTAEDASRRLEMAALGHNSESFAQEIERTLGIARTLGRRLIDDNSGEPVLVLALALGMPADALQRVLLCLNPAISQSVLRVYELSTLYEEMDQIAALRLVQIWRTVQQPVQRPATHVAHQPLYWDDPHKDQQVGIAPRPAIRWDEHAQQRRKAEG